MKQTLQSLILFVALGFIALASEADELGELLQSHFQGSEEFQLMGYEKVEQLHADEYGAMRYLVMDFDPRLASRVGVQQSVHSICSSLLSDMQLIQRLSHAGFDMLSVSFDRQSQYDCL